MEKDIDESRRSFITTSGKALAGVAIASSIIGGTAEDASAYGYNGGYKYQKNRQMTIDIGDGMIFSYKSYIGID